MVNINYRDPKPLYEQVKEGFRRLIVSGVFGENGKLPSVRELAAELAINPNTIQRAYRELESEGYIYSISGKGSFVSERKELNELSRNRLLSRFDALVSELGLEGVFGDELCRRIKEVEQR
ncbi:MAG: GntR family transcriptional regulator [Oscillospiraceae bacterium]|nr:GntR family transcriptional regulator [Oscillospiraceae bacterium]